MGPKNPFKQVGDALDGKKPAPKKAAPKKEVKLPKALSDKNRPKTPAGGVAISRQAPRRQGGASRKAN